MQKLCIFVKKYIIGLVTSSVQVMNIMDLSNHPKKFLHVLSAIDINS